MSKVNDPDMSVETEVPRMEINVVLDKMKKMIESGNSYSIVLLQEEGSGKDNMLYMHVLSNVDLYGKLKHTNHMIRGLEKNRDNVLDKIAKGDE